MNNPINSKDDDFIPYSLNIQSEETLIDNSKKIFDVLNKRRSVREFSSRAVPKEVIENLIKTASSAPSGAHKQPWTFCAIESKTFKSRIRMAAEKEEYENYHGRMNEQWLEDLKVFKTDWNKPFLEKAPWLIVAFKKPYVLDQYGKKLNNYYVNESVGMACGFLLAAIHMVGLASLTHTPSPLNFLHKILERPDNERPFLLIPVGYPESGAKVPKINRKNLDEMSKFY